MAWFCTLFQIVLVLAYVGLSSTDVEVSKGIRINEPTNIGSPDSSTNLKVVEDLEEKSMGSRNNTTIPPDSITNISETTLQEEMHQDSSTTKKSSVSWRPTYSLEVTPNISTWYVRPAELPKEIVCSYGPYNTSDTCPKWMKVLGSEYYDLQIKFAGIFKNRCHYSASIVLKPETYIDILQDTLMIMLKCYTDSEERRITITLSPFKRVECQGTYECKETYDPKSECVPAGFCRCLLGYSFNGIQCVSKVRVPVSKTKSDAIYMATLVAVACFVATVVALFALFLCNRNLFRRRPRRSPYDDVSSDIFSISDELARARLADKPPTYQEMLQGDRTHRGIPPPAYAVEPEPDGPNQRSTNPAVLGSPSNNGVGYASDDEHFRIARLAEQLTRTRISVQSAQQAPVVTEESGHRLTRTEVDIFWTGSYDNTAFTEA